MQNDNTRGGKLVLNFKILGQNVRGLNEKEKRTSIFNFTKSKADIVFLQETHSTELIEKKWEDEWGGKCIYSHGSSASRGCMILFKNNLEYKIIDHRADDAGRFILAKCEVQGERFFLINVYAPNIESDHEKFLNDLYKTLTDYYDDDYYRVIQEGDWNHTTDIALDRQGGNPRQWKKSDLAMKKIQEFFDAVDIWRINNPTDRKFTWHSQTRRIFSRIDRFYITDCLQAVIKEAKIIPGILSDHSAVYIHFCCNSSYLGPGMWKLNTELLKDLETVSVLNGTIDNVLNSDEFTCKRAKWDYLKYKVKETSIIESKKKAKSRREEEEKLEKDVKTYQEQFLKNTESPEILENLNRSKTALENMHEKRTKSLIIQSRIQYYEEGEKNSKVFLNLVKKNQENSLIRSLKTNDGTVDNPEDILKEINKFYKNLYDSKDIEDPKVWINDIKNDIPQIREEDYETLGKSISKEELAKSLKTFSKNKSPGNDGLPMEFYIIFWQKISDLFLDSLNEGLTEGELSNSQRQTLIRLIGKKDKDKTELKFWRPLNLINVDVKIFTKLLALRILPILNYIIHPNQSAYVKGRFIGEGIKTIDGMINYIRENKLDAYVLAIDFEKAFDSIEWPFIWEALKSYGFPDTYINFIKTVYSNIETCVINGGKTSTFFKVTRGARQGDPLSALIFILALELLLIKIRKNKDIKGIKIGDEEIKLSSYADDLTNFLSDAQSVTALFTELNVFSRYSGLRCNNDKTEAMKLGASNMNHGNGIKMVDCMKITGVYFSFDITKQITKNYEDVLVKIEKTLNLWKQRGISLIGRIQIVKTYAFSQIRFKTNFVPPPQDFITQFNKIIFSFIWNGSAKVKKLAMIADYENGGLKVPDLDIIMRTQRVMWVRRFLVTSNHPWKAFFKMELKKVGGEDILFNTSLNLTSINNSKMEKSYKAMLIDWGKWTERTLSSENILDQHLFFNAHITKRNGESPFFQSLLNKNICQIKDIVFGSRLMNFNEIQTSKNLTHNEVMHFLSLCSCMHNNMKTLIRAGNHMLSLTRKEDFLEKLVRESSKSIYKKMLSNFEEVPNSERKIKNEFNLDLSQSDFEKIYTLPFSCSIESKLRSFQFKINHYYYFTNQKLHRIKIKDDPNCTFCKTTPETIKHLFVECPKVKPL